MAVTAGSEGRKTVSAPNLKAIVDFAIGSHARAAVVLLVVALLTCLPGFFRIPPIDRDEARFAQATKQMVETGDYIDIRFQDEVRYKKPVGIYWLQAGVVKAAGALGLPQALTTIWLYRIPSLVGALGAVLLTYWTALAFVSRRAAVLAGMMMASCLILAVEARLAKTDAMLLLTVVAVMGALARCYLPEQRGRLDTRSGWLLAAVFWTALAGGVLLKGPLILLFVGLTLATLVIVDRSWRWLLPLRPLPGLVWFAVLVLPWFITILTLAGKTFIAESAGRDLLPKIFSGQEGHGAPPGYYFLLFWATFWPGATLAGLATPAVWAARREPATKFLLAWLVPAWVAFELVVTKLPHYVLPLYPAIAILIAGVLEARLSRRPALVTGTTWWCVFPLLTGVGGIVAHIMIGRQFGLLSWPLIGASVVMGFLAWRQYESDGAEQSLLRAVVAAILLWIAIFALILPSLGPLFPSAMLSRILRDSGCTQPLAASTVGYQEPSLVFLAGTSTRFTNGAGAAEFLRGGECRFAFVDAREQRSFAQRAEAIGLRYSPGPRIDAFNLGHGRPVAIAVYRSGAAP
jgi:4-amino-4-deoxy-L-arabinose transferase-like glycosyltransferase